LNGASDAVNFPIAASSVYNGELNQLAKGIYGSFRTSDPNRFMEKEIEKPEELTTKLETHLRRSLEHLRATQGRNAVVFFDNIDQREVEFQDAVYLVAQSMSENWGLTTFVSLRPETFNASRRSGSLAAYQSRVFTISPPKIDEVVTRRLGSPREQSTPVNSRWVPKGSPLIVVY
jgi:hypothetical protein